MVPVVDHTFIYAGYTARKLLLQHQGIAYKMCKQGFSQAVDVVTTYCRERRDRDFSGFWLNEHVLLERRLQQDMNRSYASHGLRSQIYADGFER
jgi:hypothetical protein